MPMWIMMSFMPLQSCLPVWSKIQLIHNIFRKGVFRLRMILENFKLDVPRVPGMLRECGGMVSEIGFVVKEENTSILCLIFISLF